MKTIANLSKRPLIRHRSEVLAALSSVKGFTLIELMITVSIMAILAAIAAPNFADLIQNSRAAAVTSELASSINLARSEAVRRGTTVTICKSANPTDASPTCTVNGSWEQGWLVFVDAGTIGTFDAGSDTRLRVGQPTASNTTITGSNGNIANYVNFSARGIPASSGSFSACVNHFQRSLTVSATGRLHIAAGTTC